MGKRFVDILDSRFNKEEYQDKYFEGIALLRIDSKHKIEAMVLYGKIGKADTKILSDNMMLKDADKKINTPFVDDDLRSSIIFECEEIEGFEESYFDMVDYDRTIDYDYNYELDCEYDGDEFENDEYYEEEEPYSTWNEVF